jgi:tricorn protease-like protein
MIETGQIWRHNSSDQQIRIKNVSNMIVVAEIIPDGRQIFITTIALENEYRLADLQAMRAVNGKARY